VQQRLAAGMETKQARAISSTAQGNRDRTHDDEDFLRITIVQQPARRGCSGTTRLQHQHERIALDGGSCWRTT